MALVVPNVGEQKALELYLKSVSLTLKLYSNNVVPGESDTAATFTEVSGGGYAAKILLTTGWTITPGNPTVANYLPIQTFNFTGVTNAPGTIYGYFIVDSLGVLRWAERFGASIVPFTPVAGSVINITGRFECS